MLGLLWCVFCWLDRRLCTGRVFWIKNSLTLLRFSLLLFEARPREESTSEEERSVLFVLLTEFELFRRPFNAVDDEEPKKSGN